jgi:hypothetical protein
MLWGGGAYFWYQPEQIQVVTALVTLDHVFLTLCCLEGGVGSSSTNQQLVRTAVLRLTLKPGPTSARVGISALPG